MTPIERVVALTLESIAKLPLDASFQREMTRILTQAHTSAYMLGTAERLGVSPDSGLFKGLSRAERADIKTAVQAQLTYLKTFTDAMPEMSEAAIRNRASLYAGSIRPTYYGARFGDWDIPAELLPGNQQCGGRCHCTIDITDHGDGTGTLTRTLGDADHCDQCVALEGDHPVVRAHG